MAKGLIGWRITKEGQYKINMPILSEEEEELIIEIEGHFREITRIREFQSKDDLIKELTKALEKACNNNGYVLKEHQMQYLTDIAYKHIYGLGFFEYLLNDDSIEEIAIIGLNKPAYVFISNKGWQKANAEITSIDYLMDVVNKMASVLGRRITLQHPRLDTTLPDGSRLHASMPPISEGELTIRKFRQRPLSIKELVNLKAMPINAAVLLSFFMQGDFSLIVAGNTASGKTTLLNSLFSFCPANERLLVTEETPEINPLHEHKLKLLASKDMEITLMDLVYDSLRMRPDRVVVGEIRNAEEARALIDVLLAGQARGAYATFHAKSGNEALSRLLSFGISKMDINSIDVIAVQKRMLIYDKEKRAIEERRRLVELSIYNEQLINIIKYHIANDSWEFKNLDSLYTFIGNRLGMGKSDVKEEIKRREELIKKAPDNYKEFFFFVQRHFYGIG
ncbi:MAG: ATPase, T2SS/T4P/T4SS family [Candidatus Anstonellales archaeon]